MQLMSRRMTVYKSLDAALCAAFAPASPYYGRSEVSELIQGGGHGQWSPQDAIAQAALTYVLARETLSRRDFGLISAIYAPSDTEDAIEAKLGAVRPVVAHLVARHPGVPRELCLDVVRRVIAVEPIGAYNRDWPVWLRLSRAQTYRVVAQVRGTLLALVDTIHDTLRAAFIDAGIIPSGCG